MSNVDNFLGHKKGSLISLTSTAIILEHGVTELNVKITEVRRYTTEDGSLNYTGYVCGLEGDNDAPYMLLVRKVDDEDDGWDMLLTYKQAEASTDDATHLLTDDGQDLVKQFDIDIEDVNGMTESVNWAKKSATVFGVEYEDGYDDGIKTIAEYSTASDVGGYQHGFMEWSGDSVIGWLEFWIGMPIAERDVSFLSGETL